MQLVTLSETESVTLNQETEIEIVEIREDSVRICLVKGWIILDDQL